MGNWTVEGSVTHYFLKVIH